MTGLDPHTLQARLAAHLDWWGLRRFDSDEAYFQWQRERLSETDITDLHKLVEAKQASGAPASAEVAFYDRTADPRILPVLYSQRYDYFIQVGPLVAHRLGNLLRASSATALVLDFGCGPGILTTFYATLFPSLTFVGVDRSEASLAVARERAQSVGLTNLRFDSQDVGQDLLPGPFDLIIATQALLQAEQDPGLPSLGWHTFERAGDAALQQAFETRTGLAQRLDRLCAALGPGGRLILFEKTRLLARRIPFQRALASRGLHLLESPIPIRYQVVEEISDDGPLYVVGQAQEPTVPTDEWDEAPERPIESMLYRCRSQAAELVWSRLPTRHVEHAQQWDDPQLGSVTAEWGKAGYVLSYFYLAGGQGFRQLLIWLQASHGLLFAPGAGEDGAPMDRLADLLARTGISPQATDDPAQAPVYENHHAMAQTAWEQLPWRIISRKHAWQTSNESQAYVELGTTSGLAYLYHADTFDRRHLVLMDRERSELLDAYFQALIAAPQTAPQ